MEIDIIITLATIQVTYSHSKVADLEIFYTFYTHLKKKILLLFRKNILLAKLSSSVSM